MAYRPDSGRQLKSAVKSHTSLIFVLDDTAYCKMYSWKNILLNMPKSHRINLLYHFHCNVCMRTPLQNPSNEGNFLLIKISVVPSYKNHEIRIKSYIYL